MKSPGAGALALRLGGQMHSSQGATGQGERIPRVCADCDPVSAVRSPAEGFLLSRIDGSTPWNLLRQIGGIAPEEVDRALERWIDEGVLVVETKPLTPSAPQVESAPPAAPCGNAVAVDASIDLPEDLQRRILEFDAALEQRSYHEILGVERSADTRAIKRAYFELSKEFHPDRYFRREIGDYAGRLERIFKNVALAYELLSDPTTRAEIERSMAPEPDPGAYRQADPGRSERIGPEARSGYRTPTRMENLERLRRLFKVPKKLIAERQFRARQFYQAARLAVHHESWLEAGASVRLAIAFDPWNREYKEGFAEIQAQVHRARAADLLEQADSAAAKSEALQLLEEALNFRPCDVEANARAAVLAVETGELERAREYAGVACELEPDVARHHATLCRVLRRQGDQRGARAALERAKRLDPSDLEVKAEERQLKRNRDAR
jgi:curved DNA-binding protein CbpA